MKVSSRVRNWVGQYKPAVDAQDRLKEATQVKSLRLPDLPAILAVLDEYDSPLEDRMLIELANLQSTPQGIERFRKLLTPMIESIAAETDDSLIELRDELRQMIRTKADSHTIERWFDRESLVSPEKWTIFWPLGIIRPMRAHFRGKLAWAYCRHFQRLQMCGNPECPAPYYIARRFDQKYCSANDVCTRYANRVAANRYWNEKGKQKRQSKKLSDPKIRKRQSR